MSQSGSALARHAGLDPASTFFTPTVKERWTPDQARGDELIIRESS